MKLEERRNGKMDVVSQVQIRFHLFFMLCRLYFANMGSCLLSFGVEYNEKVAGC